MKLIFLLCLFISSGLLAAENCLLYEVKGVARIHDKMIRLEVNKDTMSEFFFSVNAKDEHKLAPYLNTTSVGTYIFKAPPQSKDTILSVKSITRSTPDPINHSNNSYVKKMKAVKCQ